MKLVIKPVGDYRGTGKVFRVKSTSNPVGWHFVVVLETTEKCGTCGGSGGRHTPERSRRFGWGACPSCGGSGSLNTQEIECSCTGYQVHDKCWHVEKVLEWVDNLDEG